MSAPPGANGLSGSASGADCGRVGVASGSGGRMTAATVGVRSGTITITGSSTSAGAIADGSGVTVNAPRFQPGNVVVQQPHGATTPWPAHQPYPPYGYAYGWPAPTPAPVVHHHQYNISGGIYGGATVSFGAAKKQSQSSDSSVASRGSDSSQDSEKLTAAAVLKIVRDQDIIKKVKQVIREKWAMHAEFVGQMERLVQLQAGLDLSDEARENVQEMDALIRAYHNRLNEPDDADAGQD
ncbi:expressed unknown protein [Seminavis robusta]|uniref:Uncharacterized protein n=1 Tax=Seminavis robusta TaxID=568900 RepID=A0A9N8EWP5_9STRA|nr:expressed unknown protein [Seminavis robusta]|eukprot:Sro2245_g320540.1 n/a (239) ;mRNA; f:6020-6863